MNMNDITRDEIDKMILSKILPHATPDQVSDIAEKILDIIEICEENHVS